MIEELLRIENGVFVNAGNQYQFDLSFAKGGCIGIFVDNHRTSGTACMGIFTGRTQIEAGRVFLEGNRTGYQELRDWIRQNVVVIDRNRFESAELTAGDYLRALSDPAGREDPEIRARMGITFGRGTALPALSMSEYYRLAAYRTWTSGKKLVVLDRITEILRQQDLEQFMDCMMLLLEKGSAVLLLDMDEAFMFRYAARIDLFKNRRLCCRLYPEEYGDRLYDALGWRERKKRFPETAASAAGILPGGRTKENGPEEAGVRSGTVDPDGGGSANSPADGGHLVEVSGLVFEDLPPMSFCLDAGEIGILQDENYRTGASIRKCFLGRKGWKSGSFCLNGTEYSEKELRKMVGKQIAVQIEMPDRSGGALFDDLSALENISLSLLPKAGKHILRRQFEESILREAEDWFEPRAMRQKLRVWTLPERLRLSYYRWYLMNPMLLICLFPFLGQESVHHSMIIDAITRCAQRGMAVWIISSGIHRIPGKTDNTGFLERLRFLD